MASETVELAPPPNVADGAEAAENTDKLAYRHVRLSTVGTRQVRYVRIEPLRPRRIVIDDEDL